MSQERVNSYLKGKLNEYKTSLTFTIPINNKYDIIYGGVSNPYLKEIFPLIHYYLNNSFKKLNRQIRSRRFTADDSRTLLRLIDEIEDITSALQATTYVFKLDSYYQEVIDECNDFLQESGGSLIPNNFEKVDIIETTIFKQENSIQPPVASTTSYTLTGPIGQGSYAAVYKYKDDFYERVFAVKRAHTNLSEEERERFKREFEEMQKLNSPYVIEVYRFDEEKYEYIMEYADETLESYIQKNNTKLQEEQRIYIVNQVLRAFTYINKKGVLHRDISPNNILLKMYDDLIVVKVSDFGLVKLEESNLTRKSTEIKGYFNDQQGLETAGFHNYEIRHETYALTRLIYYVMTGRKNYKEPDNQEFDAFYKKGVSSYIDERYKSIKELRDAFSSAFSKEQVSN